jgi:hypothetical protein
MSKTRSRPTSSGFVFSPDLLLNGVPILPSTKYKRDYELLEELVDSSHPWPPPKGSNGDYGGSFHVRRARWDVNLGWGYRPDTGGIGQFGWGAQEPVETRNGPFNTSSLPALISSSTMLAEGTKGWAKFKPTRSQGGLDQFFGEIHQLPSVSKIKDLRLAFLDMRGKHGWNIPISWRTRTFLKTGSDNFLNYVFGWLPLISDLRDAARNTILLEKRLTQLYRDNGKPVRRSGTIDSYSDTSVTNSKGNGTEGWLFPGFPALTDMDKSVTVTTETKFLFSGRFRYYIHFPSGPPKKGVPFADGIPSREKYQLNRILYGGEITPQTLYEVTPWSWLVDWVTPLGDLIGNFVNDSVDNLVADYAYVTAYQKQSTSYVVRAKGLPYGVQPFEARSTLTTELIQRQGASPYGFGLLYSDFSPKQLTILSALGIQRFLK